MKGYIIYVKYSDQKNTIPLKANQCRRLEDVIKGFRAIPSFQFARVYIRKQNKEIGSQVLYFDRYKEEYS